VPQPFEFEGATIRVFLGELLGRSSTAKTFTRVVGAQLDLPARATVTVPVDAAFEHGILVDAGSPLVDGHPVRRGEIGYLAPGAATLTISCGEQPLRALLIGGEPLGESIVMWWNFIGRSHEEITEYRARWQADVIAGGDADGRFGHVSGYPGAALPAPELPNIRLRPRE
jgi:redox-sensitive bicupin YhaK (pirin superfamily)